MKFYDKFEDFINKMILKLAEVLKNFVIKITPSKVKKITHDSAEKISSTRYSISEKIQNLKKHSHSKIEQLKTHDYKKLIDEKKKVIITKASETKEIVKSTPPKKWINLLGAFLAIPLIKLKDWFIHLSPNQIMVGTIVGAISLMASISIYNSTKSIVDSEKARRPASIVKVEIDVRPIYYQNELKEIKFEHVSIPITIQNLGQTKSLSIDITVKSTTQYAALFIKKYPHLFTDALMTEIHPIVPSFPLTEEGKTIIREKIMEVFNEKLDGQVFDAEPIEGKIENVFINYILSV